MAVYTEVTDEALIAHLTRYDIGELHSLKGIAGGVENSNYMLTTDAGNFIAISSARRSQTTTTGVSTEGGRGSDRETPSL